MAHRAETGNILGRDDRSANLTESLKEREKKDQAGRTIDRLAEYLV